LILGEDEQRRRRAMGILLAVAIGVPLAVLILYLTFSARHPVKAAAMMPDVAPASDSAPAVSPTPIAASNASTASAGSAALAASAASAKPGSAKAASPAGALTGAAASGAPANASAGTAPVTSTTKAAAAATGAIAANEPLRLKIMPDGPCWVRVRADDGLHHEQLLQKGEVYTLDARNAFDLVVGDAGTFRFTVNDRRGRAIGDRGEVVEARLTRANLPSWLAPAR
jgi:cytoskeletal protein RodZ